MFLEVKQSGFSDTTNHNPDKIWWGCFLNKNKRPYYGTI